MRSTSEDVVIALARHQPVTVEPVNGVVGRVAAFAERFHEVGRRFAVILNDQKSHVAYRSLSQPRAAGRISPCEPVQNTSGRLDMISPACRRQERRTFRGATGSAARRPYEVQARSF